jgi:hypothetical protein
MTLDSFFAVGIPTFLQLPVIDTVLEFKSRLYGEERRI